MKAALGVLIFLNIFILPGTADELLFVQAVWRHGDRSPTTTYPNDPHQEDAWHQGWGQLSPLGMKQHLDLGEKLRSRYITNTDNTYNIVPDGYSANQIYVRSTDVNRTLISAMSNMITMFPGKNESDECFSDYPEDSRWPRNEYGSGWVPIPIHTINDEVDFTLNADLDCPRKTELWNLVTNGPEYQEMKKNLTDFLDHLTNVTGMTVTLDNLWVIFDALFIESQNGYSWPEWANEIWDNSGKTVFELINQTNDILDMWDNGLGLSKNGDIDFSIEIPKIKGGSLLWSMIGHMQQKLSCYNNSHADGCGFFNELVYYAYSAHDTTIVALFSTLGFHMTNWNEEGYPHYSSCVTVELWQTLDNKPYVKFIYFPLGEPEYDITSSITGCEKSCTLQELMDRSEVYKPEPDAKTLCATSLNAPNSGASRVSILFSFITFALIFLSKTNYNFI